MNPTNQQSTIKPVKLPLHEILLANGYEIDREKSSNRNPVLKSNAGHKVIISLMSNGDYLYFNPNDNNDKGNIYSLCKNHGLNLNEMLESYLQMPLEKKFAIKSQNTRDNIKEIVDKFNNLPCYDGNVDIYFKNRSINSAIINIYAKNIKVDSHNNVYFPQYSLINDRNNIFVRGYTMKFATPIYKDKDGKFYDKPLKSITKGEKGLEILMPKDTSKIQNVILAESSIDSLSFAEIANINNAILIATSGNINIEHSMETIEFIHSKLNIKQYHLAFDNDEMGNKFRESYKEALLNKNYAVINHSPYSKDFNDDLKIFKILNMKDSIECGVTSYHTNKTSKEELQLQINKATENLLDNLRYGKKKEDSVLLKKIRKLDKLLPKGIDSKLKAYFNDKVLRTKDKRIKAFEM